jgi:hypothetical protein
MDWNNAPKEKFTIAVLGNSPVFDEMTKFAQTKKIGSRQIIVRQIDMNNLSQLKIVQMLFVPKSESKNWNHIKDLVKNLSVLVVTEKQGLVKQGAGISFLLDENDDFKTKFQLNQKAVRNVGIGMNVELISLAILVE